jgi:hypothetical protein
MLNVILSLPLRSCMSGIYIVIILELQENRIAAEVEVDTAAI